jgi:acetylornithine deacetylase/succinyl-diaminopimelate desuccinylase-like protein
LYRALGRVLQQAYPGVAVVPSVSTGFTDSHFFRDAGIASYGFSPLLLPLMDFRGVHGNNERVSVENMQRGVQIMRELLNDFVTE